MDPTAYLPGMRRGRRARNLAVGVVYLVSLPLVVVSILSFTGYVVVTSRFGRPEIGGGGGRLAGSGTSLHSMFTRMAMLAITVVAATGVGGAVTAEFVTLPATNSTPHGSPFASGMTPSVARGSRPRYALVRGIA